MSMKQKQTQNTLESRRIRCLCMIGDKKAMPKWLQTHGSSGKSYKALDTSLHQNALLGPKNWTVWNQLNARRANIKKCLQFLRGAPSSGSGSSEPVAVSTSFNVLTATQSDYLHHPLLAHNKPKWIPILVHSDPFHPCPKIRELEICIRCCSFGWVMR